MPDSDSTVASLSALADISHDPKLSAVFDYWKKKSGQGALPRPRDIDPAGLPPSALPFLTLLDVVDGGERFRIRLVGTASAAAAGGDFTGKYLDAVMSGDLLVASLERYRAAIAHQRPVLAYAEYPVPNRPSIKNLLLTLPLSSDGHVVDRLLVVFSPKAEWLARDAMLGIDSPALGKPKRSHIVL